MQALGIQFPAGRRPGAWVGLAVLVFGLAMLALVLVSWNDAREALQRAEARQTRLERQASAARAVQTPGLAASAARSDAADLARLQALLQSPWGEVLRSVEGASLPQVALVSVEGESARRSLRITAEALSMADAISYVGRLRAAPQIETATLSSHEQRMAGARPVVRFALEARWRAPP